MLEAPSPASPVRLRKKESFQKRPNLFGDSALADVYYRAKELIIEHKMLRISRCETLDDGGHRLTICNLWRIERLPDGNLRFLEFDLREKSWFEVDQSVLSKWPKIRLIQRSGVLDWKALIKVMILHVLGVAGFWNLPVRKGRLCLPREKIVEILVSFYQNETKFGDSFRTGMLCMMACLHRHIIQRDVLSALLVVGLRYFFIAVTRHFPPRLAGSGCARLPRWWYGCLPINRVMPVAWL